MKQVDDMNELNRPPLYITDLSCAAAIHSSGIQPHEIKMLSPFKAIFIFGFNPRILEIMQGFYTGKLLLNPNAFNNSRVKFIQLVNKMKGEQNDR